MSAGIVFLDTETTGLDPFTEDVFEVAIIRDDGQECVFHLRPSPTTVHMMHPKAAEVNRYHERTRAPGWQWHDTLKALAVIHEQLDGAHICGAVPDFDTRFLTETYKRAGISPPRWHYHLIDIEAMAVGFLLGSSTGHTDAPLRLPWDSDELSAALGVTAPIEDRHTALGDARWVKRMYDAMTGGAS